MKVNGEQRLPLMLFERTDFQGKNPNLVIAYGYGVIGVSSRVEIRLGLGVTDRVIIIFKLCELICSEMKPADACRLL